MTEQFCKGLPIRQGERWRQQRRDIRPQVIRVAGAEQHDVDARLVPHKTIGGLGDRARTAFVDEETERVRREIRRCG